MEKDYHLSAEERKLWDNFYQQVLTHGGQESIVDTDGTKTLVLLPMLTYTLISTMLQKLKYLSSDCFNRITIGGTPVCGLRQIDRNSSILMVKLADILRVIMDGVRKQQIMSVTMIFYQKNNINQIHDCYSLVFDYETKLSSNQSTTPLETIAHVIHQVEYMFDWNDAFPKNIELNFVMSVRDQFDNDEQKVPSPFNYTKPNMKKVYENHQTKYLLGRLTTTNGKIWLKFLPNSQQLSGSTIRSEDLPTKENISRKPSIDPKNKQTKVTRTKPQQTTSNSEKEFSPVPSPKLKKKTKRSTGLTETSKSGSKLPGFLSSISSKAKKGTSFLSAVKSLIVPSKTPAPITSSTPNPNEIVLIPPTSTPKPGETASRIVIGKSSQMAPLSTIQNVSSPDDYSMIPPASPTLSTFTTTDISTAMTPTISVDPRSSTAVRPPTARGQAAMARKKIAEMQIRRSSSDSDRQSNDGDNENEEFNRLFNRRKSKKVKKPNIVYMKTTKDQSDISSISSISSNTESLFTPPTGRKRPAAERTGIDDLTIEHGTPPKTPRTGRRNRISEESTRTPMDIGDVHVTVDSPRLLRSITKKLQQQASEKKRADIDSESISSIQSKSPETTYQESEIDSVYVSLQRSFVGLHYSMDESD